MRTALWMGVLAVVLGAGCTEGKDRCRVDADCLRGNSCNEAGECVPRGSGSSGSNGPTCGNSRLDVEELCDPGIMDGVGACPAGCDDGNACTRDTLNGTASACTAACRHDLVDMCAGGDGCCPQGCTAIHDSDCSVACGDGTVGPGETCDGNCPTRCDDGNACTMDVLTGNPNGCSSSCSFQPVVACRSDDGCCPAGCTSANDNDCSASCGNSVVEMNEICDGNCPATCNDGNACTNDVLTGSAINCNASCSYQAVTTCVNGDGCCAPGCTSTNDTDCSASCGNGQLEVGETCDGNCPASCDDHIACTIDTVGGSASNCSAACVFQPIVVCRNSDGCCPAGCTRAQDNDCSATCGNNTREEGETCDGNCPTTCDDGNACTQDVTTGAAASCSLACGHRDITMCTGGDGCCPSGCSRANDSDCGGGGSSSSSSSGGAGSSSSGGGTSSSSGGSVGDCQNATPSGALTYNTGTAFQATVCPGADLFWRWAGQQSFAAGETFNIMGYGASGEPAPMGWTVELVTQESGAITASTLLSGSCNTTVTEGQTFFCSHQIPSGSFGQVYLVARKSELSQTGVMNITVMRGETP